LASLDAKSLREDLKDGKYGGFYGARRREMMKIWRTGVEETRTLLTEKWFESVPTHRDRTQDASAYDGRNDG